MKITSIIKLLNILSIMALILLFSLLFFDLGNLERYNKLYTFFGLFFTFFISGLIAFVLDIQVTITKKVYSAYFGLDTQA